jgi:hypothetical protein
MNLFPYDNSSLLSDAIIVKDYCSYFSPPALQFPAKERRRQITIALSRFFRYTVGEEKAGRGEIP